MSFTIDGKAAIETAVWQTRGSDDLNLTVSSTPVDITAPILTLPDAIAVPAETQEGTPVSRPEIQAFLDSATATDNQDPNLTVSHDAPQLFPPGQDTVVTFTATDQAGNQSSGTATVTVQPFLTDITAPDLTLPDNIVVAAETLEGTSIT
ncbi:MAG: hypothetical protein BZY88_14785, partial [SAR202 cluster bacterium Io17-Chloro-G9]